MEGVGDASAPLARLQHMAYSADRPLVLFWILRRASASLVWTIAVLLRLEDRTPSLVRLAVRTRNAAAYAATATAAVMLACASASDSGALWSELGACVPAQASRTNALIAASSLMVHFSTLEWAPSVLSYLCLALVGRASSMAFVLASSALVNGSRISQSRDAATPAVLMAFYLSSLQLSEHVRETCGPAQKQSASTVAIVCYLEALRWGSLSLWRLSRE